MAIVGSLQSGPVHRMTKTFAALPGAYQQRYEVERKRSRARATRSKRGREWLCEEVFCDGMDG